MLGATRHFEASFATIEWFAEERVDDLTDEQIAAIEVYHDLLVSTSEELWGAQPPKLAEKNGDVPSNVISEEWWQENH